VFSCHSVKSLTPEDAHKGTDESSVKDIFNFVLFFLFMLTVKFSVYICQTGIEAEIWQV